MAISEEGGLVTLQRGNHRRCWTSCWAGRRSRRALPRDADLRNLRGRQHLHEPPLPRPFADWALSAAVRLRLPRRADRAGRASLGLHIHPEGRVYITPNIGGFVGADTVGVIVASELDLADGPRAAIDIGTNGEIVVAHDGEVYACSTAAGPAFEGARISQGMRAASGAIDKVEIGEEVQLSRPRARIPPLGLCGSGLVDVVAGLVRAGVVSETGRMLPPQELSGVPEKVRRRVVENGGRPGVRPGLRGRGGRGKAGVADGARRAGVAAREGRHLRRAHARCSTWRTSRRGTWNGSCWPGRLATIFAARARWRSGWYRICRPSGFSPSATPPVWEHGWCFLPWRCAAGRRKFPGACGI